MENMDSPAEIYSHRVTITYRNWRGEFGRREISPIRLIWGSNKWHPEPQWLIEAWDIGKSEIRTFALSGISGTGNADRVEGLRKAAKSAIQAAERELTAFSTMTVCFTLEEIRDTLRAALDGASGQETTP
jgi:predicted DNA-binding transcriptional regulator YafY